MYYIPATLKDLTEKKTQGHVPSLDKANYCFALKGMFFSISLCSPRPPILSLEDLESWVVLGEEMHNNTKEAPLGDNGYMWSILLILETGSHKLLAYYAPSWREEVS